ncbi:isoaspartyl peptidase/L-asparaginase [Sinomonas sp. ASV322]|uniref:isoaspartyl peptidase/L-asparaginase family protein n=1 Tax=Sinomonas sp. ASV322 TaxID=3041920 RepID=UPI0027DD306F|nr:isoaspartyl peptidase/L-asparaginase [Sinomonas sp. ASV322]MDQ4503012.1 isoaspartyl peptidase/L-asparaginase [Sinomonas sp. ASV322]
MHVIDITPSADGTAIVLHGGAGGRTAELTPDEHREYAAGLEVAYRAGRAVLDAHGSALDAVCAAVEQLEDSPLFNAGHGAALNAQGEAELDASIMAGTGRAGAVAAVRRAKNPVFAARHVMENTPHVLLVAPSSEVMAEWGLQVVDPEYFITDARRRQLETVLAGRLEPTRHGTVGAVARDAAGHLAAATSTGGIVGQHEGRIGDTPIIGAGNYARDGIVAVSCTGIGEAFMEGVVSHEIYARLRFGGVSLAEAVRGTIVDELDPRAADGGVIAVGADGRVVVAHNSTSMFAAYERDGALVTLT